MLPREFHRRFRPSEVVTPHPPMKGAEAVGVQVPSLGRVKREVGERARRPGQTCRQEKPCPCSTGVKTKGAVSAEGVQPKAHGLQFMAALADNPVASLGKSEPLSRKNSRCFASRSGAAAAGGPRACLPKARARLPAPCSGETRWDRRLAGPTKPPAFPPSISRLETCPTSYPSSAWSGLPVATTNGRPCWSITWARGSIPRQW